MVVSDEQRLVLVGMVRSQTIDVRAARRAHIILLASEGLGDREIARRLGIGRIQAARWRGRFTEGGVAAIRADLPRSGRKPRIDAAEIVRVTTQTTPEGATHWSTRKLGAKLGISDTTVLKVWRANGLKPHLVETFKVSRDPKFVEKLEDIVGLYIPWSRHGWRSIRASMCISRQPPLPGLTWSSASSAVSPRIDWSAAYSVVFPN